MNVLRIYPRGIFFLLLLVLVAPAFAEGSMNTLQHDELERSYYLYVPDSYDGSEAVPLVLALHPSVSSGLAMAAITGLNQQADEGNFIVAYPNTFDRMWDDGRLEVNLNDLPNIVPIDDVGFIQAVVDDVEANFNVSDEDIHLIGHGNGGSMAFRIACEIPEVFQTISAVNAIMWEFHTTNCDPENGAVNLMILFGQQNPFADTMGQYYSNGVREFRVYDMEEVNEFWDSRFECVNHHVEENLNQYTDCKDDVSITSIQFPQVATAYPRTGEYQLNRFDIDATEIILTAIFGELDPAQFAGNESTETPRNYYVYVPPQYDPETPTPAVFVLHGRPGNGAGIAYITEMNRVAEANGFIVVYPDGLEQAWNYPKDIPVFTKLPQDDADFLSKVIDDLAIDLNIDQERVYVTGFSNGGFMTERLACESADRFAGFAAVGATAYVGLTQICEEQPPVPLMIIHGTDDVSVPWNGTVTPSLLGNVYATAPIPQTIAFWTEHLGCDGDFEQEMIEQKGDSPATMATRFEFTECDGRGDFVFYGIDNGGHAWPGVRGVISPEIEGNVNMDIDASQVIWDFFSEYSLQENP